MMKVGSDFSGIGSPEVALKNLGIDIEHVFACDVDEYAKKSFLEIHKPNVFFDDIRNRNNGTVERLDMSFAGFPFPALSISEHLLLIMQQLLTMHLGVSIRPNQSFSTAPKGV